jgi:AraC family transcriptional regulator
MVSESSSVDADGRQGLDALSHDHEALHDLLEAASAALESNRGMARACIARAIKHTVREKFQGGLAPWQARRVLMHIEANIGQRMCSAELASLAGLSTSHFSRAFRQTFGEPPMAYVSKQRTLRAQELMLGTNVNLAEVALECGLCDQAHLTRLFHRIVGTTPALWRRQFSTGLTTPSGS